MKPSKDSRDSAKCLFFEGREAKQLGIKDIPYEYPPEIYEFERLIGECKRLDALLELQDWRKQQEKGNEGQV